MGREISDAVDEADSKKQKAESEAKSIVCIFLGRSLAIRLYAWYPDCRPVSEGHGSEFLNQRVLSILANQYHRVIMSGVYDKLRKYCSDTLPFPAQELDLIDQFFEVKNVIKKGYLLESGHVCDFIAFISSGTIRHFHVKDGSEKTCDISFENNWVTDFHSFNNRVPGVMNLQALEDSIVLFINAEKLAALYQTCPRYETFGRLMAERVAQRATTIAMSLSSEKPEERFLKLLDNRPDLFQRVPQKYIANFLGISPESLSRIQKRILAKSKS